MTYQLIVKKNETDPNYAIKLAEWKTDNSGFQKFGNKMEPYPNITTDALVCNITDEQFEAIRKSVLEIF